MPIHFKPLAALIALALVLTASLANAVVQGVDVSNLQGIINWTSVANAGIGFAFVKATEGADFVDPRFSTNMSGAAGAGLLVGPYHFARPDSFSTDPLDATNEANHFVDAVQGYYQNSNRILRPVVDLETLSGQPNTTAERQFLSQWIRDFAQVVEDRLDMSPLVYVTSNFATTYLTSDVNQFPLWIGRPSNTNDYALAIPPSAPSLGIWSGKGYAFWQWTVTGNVSGFSGSVDRDVFGGTVEQLMQQHSNVPEPSVLSMAAIVAVFRFGRSRDRRGRRSRSAARMRSAVTPARTTQRS